MKLYFLLCEPTKSFCEGDPTFMSFFKSRYVSLDVQLRQKLPRVYMHTLGWLKDEVFLQEDDDEIAQIDEEQREFEGGFLKEVEEARNNFYGEARRLVRGTAGGSGEGGSHD